MHEGINLKISSIFIFILLRTSESSSILIFPIVSKIIEKADLEIIKDAKPIAVIQWII